jgi:hypothetical protein
MLNTMNVEEGNNVPALTKAQSEERRRMLVWFEQHVEAGRKKPFSELVTLTPILAEILLEHNPINRPLSKPNVADLMSDVGAGRWTLNGESIVVSKKGYVLDGQHRCWIVKHTGVAIETFMTFGIDEEARYTIDIGKPKSAPNFLSMKGRKDTNNLAAAVGCYLQWRQHGYIRYSGGRPTKTEVLAGADLFKGIDDSVALVTGATKRGLGSRSVLAFCHYVFWKRSGRENADHFMLRLIEGDGLKKGDPILVCRNRLTGNMHRGNTANDRAELVFKAWNHYRRGETVTSLKLSGGKLPKVER